MRNVWLCLLLVLFLAPAQAIPQHGFEDHTRATLFGDQVVHHWFDVEESFRAWNEEFPEFVDTQTIGFSGVLQLPIDTIVVTDESVEIPTNPHGRKWIVYLDGGHHGNEYLGVELTMYYLEEIFDQIRQGNEETREFLRTHELHVTPMVNPEGNLLDTRKNANQVDPNRNYDYQWGGPGSGAMVTDLNYRGPSAMSEPEVQANAAYGIEIHPDLWITMHSGVSEFYWPWGWTFEETVDKDFFNSLEAPFENATNGAVDAMQASYLYLAAGATDDWGYATLGVPTFTYEVHGDQFLPVYGEPIPQVLEDQLAGLRWIVGNTKDLGARIDVHELDGNFHVANLGWGNATNVTVAWDAGMEVLPLIAAGDMIVFEGGAPAQDVTVTYTRLQSDMARDVVIAYQAANVRGSDDATAATPIVALPLLLAGLLLLRRQ